MMSSDKKMQEEGSNFPLPKVVKQQSEASARPVVKQQTTLSVGSFSSKFGAGKTSRVVPEPTQHLNSDNSNFQNGGVLPTQHLSSADTVSVITPVSFMTPVPGKEKLEFQSDFSVHIDSGTDREPSNVSNLNSNNRSSVPSSAHSKLFSGPNWFSAGDKQASLFSSDKQNSSRDANKSVDKNNPSSLDSSKSGIESKQNDGSEEKKQKLFAPDANLDVPTLSEEAAAQSEMPQSELPQSETVQMETQNSTMNKKKLKSQESTLLKVNNVSQQSRLSNGQEASGAVSPTNLFGWISPTPSLGQQPSQQSSGSESGQPSSVSGQRSGQRGVRGQNRHDSKKTTTELPIPSTISKISFTGSLRESKRTSTAPTTNLFTGSLRESKRASTAPTTKITGSLRESNFKSNTGISSGQTGQKISVVPSESNLRSIAGASSRGQKVSIAGASSIPERATSGLSKFSERVLPDRVTSGLSRFSEGVRVATATVTTAVSGKKTAGSVTRDSEGRPLRSASMKKTAQSLVFQKLDSHGNPITSYESLHETESQLTLHLRYLGFSFICALPLFFAISSACATVVPGYTPCNFGEENCDFEYGLNTFVYTALVCPFVYVACPCFWDHEKFMDPSLLPLKFFLVRLTIPWMSFQLLIQYITKNDWEYAGYYLVGLRLSSAVMFFPYLEAMRFYLGYDDWYDPRKSLSFPNHPTWKERLPPLYGLIFIIIPATFWTSYAATDAAFIATGEAGELLQDWRMAIFFVCKRISYLLVCVCVSFFEEPPMVAGRIRQLIPWTLHICLGLATPIIAMNAKDWWALGQFVFFDCLAFALRVFGFSDLLDENFIIKKVKLVLRFQKMPIISGMNLQELRGWELICESVSMQIIYFALFMFYIFSHVFLNAGSFAGDSDCPARDYHVVYRFWFPYSHSLPGLVILLVVDYVQDVTVRHYVVRKTGCSFSLMMGQPVLSYTTHVSMLCVGVVGFFAHLVSQCAYFFEKEKLGVFKTDDPLDCAY